MESSTHEQDHPQDKAKDKEKVKRRTGWEANGDKRYARRCRPIDLQALLNKSQSFCWRLRHVEGFPNPGPLDDYDTQAVLDFVARHTREELQAKLRAVRGRKSAFHGSTESASANLPATAAAKRSDIPKPALRSIPSDIPSNGALADDPERTT